MTHSETKWEAWRKYWHALNEAAKLEIYADAQELAEHIRKRADDFVQPDSTAVVIEFSPAIRILQANAEDASRRARATQSVLLDVMAGRSILLGRIQGDESYRIELVDPQFVVGAHVTYFISLKRGNDVIEGLRLIPVSNEQPKVRGNPTEKPNKWEDPLVIERSIPPTQKVPHPIKMRQLAVEACFNDGLIDFDDTSLPDRVEIYLEWIETTYPTCDLEQKGFSGSSFEQNETAFKKTRGIIGS